MNERLNVRLGNPFAIFIWSIAMFLSGIFIGAHWHPSLTHSIAFAVVAGIFMAVHELASCFFWCSLSAWWIGRRTGALDRKSV